MDFLSVSLSVFALKMECNDSTWTIAIANIYRIVGMFFPLSKDCTNVERTTFRSESNEYGLNELLKFIKSTAKEYVSTGFAARSTKWQKWQQTINYIHDRFEVRDPLALTAVVRLYYYIIVYCFMISLVTSNDNKSLFHSLGCVVCRLRFLFVQSMGFAPFLSFSLLDCKCLF